MMGGQATEQGDCSRFKGNIPHCCKKDPTVVDLLPGTPYNQQIANCCKGGVLNSWVQDPATAVSSFQLTVGSAGTSNKTVRLPKNFTLKAPGPGYTCGPAKIVKPSKFKSPDKRRVTQALSKYDLRVICLYYFPVSKVFGSFKFKLISYSVSFLSTNPCTSSLIFCSKILICSDMECYMHIFTISGPKNSYLLCFAVIILQQHNCFLPEMLLWLPKQLEHTPKLCGVRSLPHIKL